MLTIRTHDPGTDPVVPELVHRLADLDGVGRIALPLLTPDDVAAFVADLSAGSATAQQVARIVAAGRGNPLMTEQLVALGLDDLESEATAVNPMLTRIRRLDERTLRLLELAVSERAIFCIGC